MGKDGSFSREGWFVKANSGMMCVVPAWKIDEVLHLPELLKEREEELNEWRTKAGGWEPVGEGPNTHSCERLPARPLGEGPRRNMPIKMNQNLVLSPALRSNGLGR